MARYRLLCRLDRSRRSCEPRRERIFFGASRRTTYHPNPPHREVSRSRVLSPYQGQYCGTACRNEDALIFLVRSAASESLTDANVVRYCPSRRQKLIICTRKEFPILNLYYSAGKFRGFQTRLGQSFEEVLEQCQPCFFFENGESIAWGSIRFRVLKSAESFTWIAASISSGNVSPNPRSDRDALIAATALVHGMTVVTRNVSDFQATGAAVINPWQ
jgi:predicted nucleic acid-binding protein